MGLTMIPTPSQVRVPIALNDLAPIDPPVRRSGKREVVDRDVMDIFT